MQFSGPPRNIRNPCLSECGSTKTTRVHAIFMHYYYPLNNVSRVPYLFHSGIPGHS